MKKTFLTMMLLSSAAVTLPLFAQGNSEQHRMYGKGAPFTMEDLPPGLLKQDLENLPGKARGKAMRWLHGFAFPAADAQQLRVDRNGAVYVADYQLPQSAPDAPSSPSGPAAAFDPADAFLLHSKPGADKVIYVDFDGHVITGTAWNDTHDPLLAKAYDTDGNSASFSDTERERIAEIWHRVAEDYAAFDVDVTTQEPETFDRYTGHILITEDTTEDNKPMPAQGAGGVAYVNVYGASNYGYYSPALVYANRLGPYFAPYIAEAASHEMGHNMGLSHDGQIAGSAYYTGHGSGFVRWAPIMGNSYGDNVSQWSKGEYTLANNTQDDIAIINGKVSARPDDHGDTQASASLLYVDANGDVLATTPETDPLNVNTDNKGIIDSRSDEDWFTFQAAAGTVDLTVTPAWAAWRRDSGGRGANLDIEITLYDLNGDVIASADPTNNTDASISVPVAGGAYYLAVTGVGNDTTPYSDYASQGMYYISGTVPPAASDTTPPNPDPMTWASAPAASGQTSIAMTATTASDDSGDPVDYYFECVSGGSGCSDSGWQASPGYSDTGLSPGTSYSYRVRARDSSGNLTGYSVTLGATTDPAPDTTPPTPDPMTWATAPAASGQASITMTATTATDDSGGAVEYFFDCVSGGAGCSDSGWQSSTSYTDTGLEADTSYSYRVRARDEAGNETAYSGTEAATTDPLPDTTPPTPNPMTWASAPAANGHDSISMTATTASDDSGDPVDYYFECVSGGAGCSDSGWQSASSYTDTGLTAETTYSYRVRVRDAVGNTTGYSSTLAATTEAAPNTNPPAAPGNTMAVNNGNGSATVSWTDNSDNETGFEVQRQSQHPKNGRWRATNTVATPGADVTSIVDASGNDTFRYRVRAVNSYGSSAYSNWAVVTVDSNGPPDTTAPNPDPMSWSAAPAALDHSRIAMTATEAIDASGDPVQYYFDCVSGGAGCVDSGWQSSRSYTATGLDPETSYSWRVKARDAIGNETAYSPEAAAITDVAPPPDTTPPSPDPMQWDSTPAANDSSSVSMTATLATDDSGGPVEYYFECISGSCNDSGWQSSRSYTDTGLAPATTYGWQVRARDAALNENTASSVQYATTNAAPVTPAAPSNLTVFDNGRRTAAVSWSDNSNNETGFEVEREKQNKKGNWVSTTLIARPANDTGFTDNPGRGTFRYRVRSVNGTGASAYTDWVEASVD